MKARLCLVASALLLAGPALAQEPLSTTDQEMQQQQPAESMPAPQSPAPQSQADQPAMVVVSDLTEVEDGQKLVSPWGVPVDEIKQMDVYDSNGKKIGEVDVVLQDKDGEIRGIAIGYGGFLGFGEKGAVATFDQLQLKDGTVITDFDEEQLSKLPEWMKN